MEQIEKKIVYLKDYLPKSNSRLLVFNSLISIPLKRKFYC
jgi:hypothetical protein